MYQIYIKSIVSWAFCVSLICTKLQAEDSVHTYSLLNQSSNVLLNVASLISTALCFAFLQALPRVMFVFHIPLVLLFYLGRNIHKRANLSWHSTHQLKILIANIQRPMYLNNWVFHDRPVWRISVRLSDRSKVTQNKINFVKNCPQWGLNSQPPDHQSPALTTVLSHYLVVGVNH